MAGGFANVTVPFSTEPGYPRERWTFKGCMAEWKVRCNWADRYTLMEQLGTFPDDVFPYWFSFGSTPFYSQAATPMYLVEAIPEGVPETQQILGVGPTPAGSGTIIGNAGFAQYEQCLITFKYTNVNTYRGGNGLVTQISILPSVQELPVAHGGLKWASDNQLIDAREVHFYRNPCLDYRLTYLRASSIPTALFTLPGTVNSGPYFNSLLGITFPAETLLYEPGAVNVSIKSNGQLSCTVTQVAKFAYNGGHGWNWFWRAEKGQFEQQKTLSGDIYKPYLPSSWAGV